MHKGVHVEVTVADDGVGISAERLPYPFRKFSRRREAMTVAVDS